MEATDGRRLGDKVYHFVLVHGISHGAWCWYKVRTLLESSGHRVTCLDLAGAGIDPRNADDILSFDDYNKPLTDFMSQLPDNEKVVLVGHSAGGLSVTYATHKFGNKIQLAFYVAATMLKFGFTCDQDLIDKFVWKHLPKTPMETPLGLTVDDGQAHWRLQQGMPDLSQYGDIYKLGFGLGHGKPPTSAIIRNEFHKQILHNLSPLEDSRLASMLLRPGPLLALQTAKFDGGDGVDRVRRAYIRTTDDNVVRPTQQEAMIRRWAPWKEYTLEESDHSPFFSAQAHLCSFLIHATANAHE